MLAAILSLGGIGLLAAVALGFAAKKFAVEVDPRELAILEVLPGANCGACGYAGCAGYAKAGGRGRQARDAVPARRHRRSMEQIANIMGVAPVTAEPQVAVVLLPGRQSPRRRPNTTISASPTASPRKRSPTDPRSAPAAASAWAPAPGSAPSAPSR